MSFERPGPQPAPRIELDAVEELQKIGQRISWKEIIKIPGEIGSKNKKKGF
jgi:hypothetical protein